MAGHPFPCRQVVERVVGQQVDHRVEHANVGVLAAAVELAADEGPQNREARIDPTGEVGQRHS